MTIGAAVDPFDLGYPDDSEGAQQSLYCCVPGVLRTGLGFLSGNLGFRWITPRV
jgi:hypothetical protein